MLEKNKILAINGRKLKLAGVLPRYIHCSSGDEKEVVTREMMARIPFSSVYRTHSDYMADIDKAFEMSANNIEIPDELIEKLGQTNRELGIHM